MGRVSPICISSYPELVTGLEYGKGPYYSDHGDFTTAGYLAFRTADVPDKSEVKLEAGGFNTGRIMTVVNLLSDKARQRGKAPTSPPRGIIPMVHSTMPSISTAGIFLVNISLIFHRRPD